VEAVPALDANALRAVEGAAEENKNGGKDMNGFQDAEMGRHVI
jgi:hypothetical protein